jgi:hypothetical protein
LLAIANLPEEERKRTKKELRELLSQLRATHATLVQTLKLFTTNDAKTFFEEFDDFNQNFGALFQGGKIRHEARTHCDDVVQIVDDLVSKLELSTTGERAEQIGALRQLGYSMQGVDQDLIVPIMRYILSKTEVELSLINSVIRDGDKTKAIWLKERYRFDVEKLYERLREALDRMDALSSKL